MDVNEINVDPSHSQLPIGSNYKTEAYYKPIYIPRETDNLFLISETQQLQLSSTVENTVEIFQNMIKEKWLLWALSQLNM